MDDLLRDHVRGEHDRADQDLTPARLATGLAFASAAVSLYWALGGTGLLATVGGEIEELARERSTEAVVLISATVVLKLIAGVLALALTRHPPRAIVLLAGLAGAGLALYGGVLVVAGALVLTNVLDPSGDVDEYALRWHVFFWDLWFVVWGVALAVAARQARSATESTIRDARNG